MELPFLPMVAQGVDCCFATGKPFVASQGSQTPTMAGMAAQDASGPEAAVKIMLSVSRGCFSFAQNP
jgi:hypothetical protein